MATPLLSARSTLGPRGLTGGSIAGAVVGSVVGALLIALCIVPFVVRARRRRATQHGDAVIQAEMGQSQSPGGRSSPPQTDESKRPSGDLVPAYSPTGHLNGHHHPNGINGHDAHHKTASDKGAHSPTHLPPAIDTQAQGISSPASPPLSPTSKPDPGAPDHSQAYPTPPPEEPAPQSRAYRGRDSTRELSFTDSYGPPSRELTGGITSSGITEEPETFEQSQSSSTSAPHRHFSQISGSIRSLIHKRYSEHRRDSRRSTTDGARSPSIVTTDPLAQPELIQPAFEEADINARGEAWSYYNDPDLIPPSQGYIPVTSAPLTVVPPSHAPVPAPLSPVSLPDHPVVLGEAAPRPMIAQAVVEEPDIISPDSDKTVTPLRAFSRQTSTLRGPGSLSRTDSLPPLQPIVADFENYPVPFATSTSPSARPMDLMRPTNEAESAWRVHQEILKIESPSPDPEPALEYMDPLEQHQHYQTKSNPSPESDYQSPPNIALNDQEFDFTAMIVEDPDQEQVPYYFTPPPSSGPSQQNTPDTRVSDYTASPSPRSDIIQAPSVQSDSSPRLFPCDQCTRVFDQVHKLNHHRRYHERPHECTHPGCTMRFGTKTHLDRHINDKHNKTRKFHCTVHDCPYSRQGGKSFPRKDNWRRHMMNKHRITPETDPIEYGEDSMMMT
ncbi:hypothetical protein OQA88_4983 [Cercophora sp. LCS_1]